MGLNEDASAFATALYNERQRQIAKFGAQHDIPDLDPVLTGREGGCSHTRMAEHYEMPSEVRAKFLCDNAFAKGQGTWAHIAVEELAEAIGADSDEERIIELTQLATVCMGWVETIRARNAALNRGPREMVQRTNADGTSSGPGEIT